MDGRSVIGQCHFEVNDIVWFGSRRRDVKACEELIFVETLQGEVLKEHETSSETPL